MTVWVGMQSRLTQIRRRSGASVSTFPAAAAYALVSTGDLPSCWHCPADPLALNTATYPLGVEHVATRTPGTPRADGPQVANTPLHASWGVCPFASMSKYAEALVSVP
jgi:hypothetical protein